jgi:hypothetical protein
VESGDAGGEGEKRLVQNPGRDHLLDRRPKKVFPRTENLKLAIYNWKEITDNYRLIADC